MNGISRKNDVNGSSRQDDRKITAADNGNGSGKKKKIIIAAVCIAAIAVAAVVIFFLYKNKTGTQTKPVSINRSSTASSAITATGTTTVGMTTEELDLASLSTKLYVEKVYLSSGDTVAKGDKVLKISDSTLKSAKNELERAQKSADYAYREGVITTTQEKTEARSAFDQAAVKKKYAQQSYNETVKDVTDKISDLQDQISDEQDLIDEYTKAVNNNYYYSYYDVANKKKERDATFALQMKLYTEWGIEALTDTSSKTFTSTQSGQSSQKNSSSVSIPTTICGKAGFLQGYILGYSSKDSGNVPDADSYFTSWWTSNYGSSSDPSSSGDQVNYAALLTELGISYDSSYTAGWWAGNSAAAQSAAKTAYSSAFSSGAQSGKQAAATNQKAAVSSTQSSSASNNSQELVKVYEMLTAEVDEENKEYKEAEDNYEEKTAMAPTNLAKATADMQKLQAQLAEEQTTLAIAKVSAKAAYDQTLAECSIAVKTYNTAVKKADEELTALSNTKADADDDMTYFTEMLDDGYLHTTKAGNVMMVSVDDGSYISGDSVIMAYTDADSLAVAVSVPQADIASLSLGESAQIEINNYGSYTGTITAINPVASSNSKSSVTYTVTVTIDGDISKLSQNLTATVTFGGTGGTTVSGNSTVSGNASTVSGD